MSEQECLLGRQEEVGFVRGALPAIADEDGDAAGGVRDPRDQVGALDPAAGCPPSFGRLPGEQRGEGDRVERLGRSCGVGQVRQAEAVPSGG
ncbi:hypothetical protein GCM10020295_21150 [Streptomyces cinereospinus]